MEYNKIYPVLIKHEITGFFWYVDDMTNIQHSVGFEVLVAVVIKGTVFWDVAQIQGITQCCIPEDSTLQV
jgi:hypothetical protein